MSFCTVFLNDLASTERELILVLDDYHHVTASSIHNALAFILNYLPLQMHLALIICAGPPLPLARLRLRNRKRSLT
jgi:LuxR family maltose regulon positive regulatory protein